MLCLLAGCGAGLSPATTPPPATLAADSSIRAAIAVERSLDAASLPARTVAVSPFQINSPDTSLAVLGYGLADFLMTDLSRSSQLQVVDRLKLDAFLREMGLVQAGYVDSAGAAQFGRIIGARRIVLGSLTTTSASQARLDGRVGDVATGTIEATAASRSTLDALLDAEKAFAFAVFDRLGVTLTPAERALVEQRPTRSLAALLAYSRGRRAEAMRDYQRARAEYRAAARIEAGFSEAEARVAAVEPFAGLQAGGGTVGPETGGVPGGSGTNAPITSTSTLAGSIGGTDLGRVGTLTVTGINAPTIPRVTTAADPAFRQRLFATIIIILSLP
jgi:TolB-like protein